MRTIIVVLSLIVCSILTGLLHLDGLADTADAFGGGKSKERILEILKDSRKGSFGVCAICFDLLLKTACWHWCYSVARPGIIIWSLVFSRCLQACMLAWLPNARPGGTAWIFAHSSFSVRIQVAGESLLMSAAACFFVPWTTVVFSAGAAGAALACFSGLCLRKIGGITGDCIGAGNEIAEATVLLSCIAASSCIL